MAAKVLSINVLLHWMLFLSTHYGGLEGELATNLMLMKHTVVTGFVAGQELIIHKWL